MNRTNPTDTRHETLPVENDLAPARGAVFGLFLGACAWLGAAICWKLFV
jgi:hypothetical protein